MSDSSILATPIGIGALTLLLSLLPVLLLMVTPFLKLSIVFGVLRIGFGSQGVPGPGIIGVLSLVLSLSISEPMLSAVGKESAELLPVLLSKDGKKQSTQLIERLTEAAQRLSAPIEQFLKRHTGEEEITFFRERSPAASPFIFVLVPAFVLSELRSGFTMALYLFMPFLVIDLLTTTILTGMGMMMVNPVTIAFPLKLLLFVSCDGWLQLTNSLLENYGP